jgi:RecB family exonuclease
VALPPSPSELQVPEYFSPSSLGSPDPCGLKVLASAQENRDAFKRLPLNPSAAIGTVVHRGLELLATGELPDPLKWLDARLDEPTTGATPYRCLREAVPERRIETARQMFDRRATSQGGGRGWQAREEIADHAAGSRLFGPEVWLSSRALRLRGKADLISRTTDGAIEIVDFKTGGVSGPNGEIKDEYVLQLQAYALLLRERTESTPLRLVLDNGERTRIPSDGGALNLARERIEEFTSQFPKSSAVRARDVAHPGSECGSCGVRPSCAAYLDAAPGWWVDVPDEIDFEPLDTWGETARVGESETGLTVHLKDQAGRSVKIDRLDPAHGVTRNSVGKEIWLFNLCADNRRRGFKGQRPHPRLFHELPGSDGVGARAWDILVVT